MKEAGGDTEGGEAEDREEMGKRRKEGKQQREQTVPKTLGGRGRVEDTEGNSFVVHHNCT